MSKGEIRSDQFWYGDPVHIGDVFRWVRTRTQISASDVAGYAKTTPPTVSNFESDGGASLDMVERCAHALLRGRPPISIRQADVLAALHPFSQPSKVRLQERELVMLDFREIRVGSRPPMLEKLLNQLRRERRPAYIRDNLWFIHAYNGAIMHLFGLDPSDDQTFASWKSWHVLAPKFFADSAVRTGHVRTTEYFQTVIQAFWYDLQPYLFTRQARKLIARLHELSEADGLEFDQLWCSVMSFGLEEDPEFFTRVLYDPRYRHDKSRVLYAESNDQPYTEVRYQIKETFTARYKLVVWNPVDTAARNTFDDIATRSDAWQIIFAADHDRNRDFHVNNWPDVAPYIEY